MTTQIAFLRGINVGGTSTVAMADVRQMLAGLGFASPRTLLQTGNLLFESESATGPELERLLETESERRLGLRTTVMVRSAPEWHEVVAQNPFPEEAAAAPGFLLAMMLKARPAPEAMRALAAAVPGPERLALAGRELYVVYPAGIGRSKLTTRLIESKLSTRATGRNWNTVLRLAAMLTG